MKPFLNSAIGLRPLSIALFSAIAIAGCSSDDDTPIVPDNSANDVNIVVPLSSDITVPPANVDGATGEADFTINTVTGAVSGAVTVSGTTGTPTVAHIHSGAVGVAGPVILSLNADSTGNVWSAGADAALDAAGIAFFQAGETYVNVHTDANSAGELRAQLVEPAGAATGTYTITMRNTSASQPMTPPVLALHNPPTGANGIRFFEVGQPAIAEVIEIAENGNNDPLVAVAAGQTGNTISASAVGFADPANPGPLTPGASATVTMDPGAATGQVLSIVSMVVCTNDGFSGIDSMTLPTAETTFTAPIYDAGSETNVLTLNYWVPPCGGTGNIGDEEGGAITAHPGQSGSENPDFDFAAGSEFLEITITPN